MVAVPGPFPSIAGRGVRRARVHSVLPVLVFSALGAFAASRQAAPATAPPSRPGTAGGWEVVGHFRVGALSVFAERLSACYAALGFDRLLDRERVLQELLRRVPDPTLAGVDGSGPFGEIWVAGAGDELSAVPFFRLRDRRAFLAAAAAAGFRFVEGDPPRLVREREEGRSTVWHMVECGSGVLLAPEASQADVAARHLESGGQLETDLAAADLSVWLAVRRLRPRVAAKAEEWGGLLSGIAAMGELIGRPRPEPARAAGLLARGSTALESLYAAELEVWLRASRVEWTARLTPEPGCEAESWLAEWRPLPENPLPFLPAQAHLAIECGGGAARWARAALAARRQAVDPALEELLATLNGEVGISWAGEGAQSLLWLVGACGGGEEPRARVADKLGAGAPAEPVLEGPPGAAGEGAGAWAAFQRGNWWVVVLGATARQQAEAASRAAGQAPASPAAAVGPGRLEDTGPGAGLTMLRCEVALGAAAASRDAAPLRCAGRAEGGALVLWGEMSLARLAESLPVLRVGW